MPSLKLALAVYPEARVEVDERAGLTLYPSPPPLPVKKGRPINPLDSTHARQPPSEPE